MKIRHFITSNAIKLIIPLILFKIKKKKKGNEVKQNMSRKMDNGINGTNSNFSNDIEANLKEPLLHSKQPSHHIEKAFKFLFVLVILLILVLIYLYIE